MRHKDFMARKLTDFMQTQNDNHMYTKNKVIELTASITEMDILIKKLQSESKEQTELDSTLFQRVDDMEAKLDEAITHRGNTLGEWKEFKFYKEREFRLMENRYLKIMHDIKQVDLNYEGIKTKLENGSYTDNLQMDRLKHHLGIRPVRESFNTLQRPLHKQKLVRSIRQLPDKQLSSGKGSMAVISARDDHSSHKTGRSNYHYHERSVKKIPNIEVLSANDDEDNPLSDRASERLKSEKSESKKPSLFKNAATDLAESPDSRKESRLSARRLTIPGQKPTPGGIGDQLNVKRLGTTIEGTAPSKGEMEATDAGGKEPQAPLQILQNFD